jgi:methionine sulfoxide reductase heme-binding subunit
LFPSIKRIGTHSGLAALSIAAYFSAPILFNFSNDPTQQLSLALGYISLIFLIITLLIGPYRLLRGQGNPVSTNIRRDVGIWTALTAIVHVVFGLQVHLKGKMHLYFVFPANPSDTFLTIRYDFFGLANYAGAVASVLLLILLALSNDRSLRKMKAVRWKSLQRLNYAVFFLVVLHTFVYQVLEKRVSAYVAAVAIAVSVLVTIQALGFKEYSNRESAKLLRTTK